MTARMRYPLHLFNRLHRLQRLAVVLWVAMLLGIGGRVLFSPVRSHTVVPIYLTAAERWARGESLYAPTPPLDVYRNPPGVAAAFVPLTWVPERAAGVLWRGIGVAVFLVGLTAWTRRGLPRPLTATESGVVFSLIAILALPSINNGQTNLVIIGALLLGATAAAQSRGVVSGGWLALAAVVKIYPAAVGLLIAVARPRQVALWFVTGCVLFAAVPFALNDPSYVATQYCEFRNSVRNDDRTFAALYRAPQNLFLVLRVWAVPPSTDVYLGITLAVAVGMAGLVALAAYRTRNPRAVVPLALHLGCVWGTVLGPATEIHTYVILAPTAMVTLVFAWAERGTPGGRLRFLLAAIGYALLVSPVLRDMFPNGRAFHVLGIPPIGGLFVFSAVLRSGIRLARLGRSDSQSNPIAERGKLSGRKVYEGQINLTASLRADRARSPRRIERPVSNKSRWV